MCKHTQFTTTVEAINLCNKRDNLLFGSRSLSNAMCLCIAHWWSERRKLKAIFFEWAIRESFAGVSSSEVLCLFAVHRPTEANVSIRFNYFECRVHLCVQRRQFNEPPKKRERKILVVNDIRRLCCARTASPQPHRSLRYGSCMFTIFFFSFHTFFSFFSFRSFQCIPI